MTCKSNTKLEKEEDKFDSLECTICMSNKKDGIYNCDHTFCIESARSIKDQCKKCPNSNQIITSISKFYL